MPVRGYFFSETFSIFFNLNLYCPFESSKISCAVLIGRLTNLSKFQPWGTLSRLRISKTMNIPKGKNLREASTERNQSIQNYDDIDFSPNQIAFHLTYI